MAVNYSEHEIYYLVDKALNCYCLKLENIQAASYVDPLTKKKKKSTTVLVDIYKLILKMYNLEFLHGIIFGIYYNSLFLSNLSN